MKRNRLYGVLLFVGLGTVGCQSTAKSEVGSRNFGSRNSIVPAIDLMLRDKDWTTLAKYYDLEHSEVTAEELLSGDYFYDSTPGAAPATEEYRRYLRPFAPGARLDHEMDGGGQHVVTLVMVLDLHRGTGKKGQRVYRFRVKRHTWGWRILPGTARVDP